MKNMSPERPYFLYSSIAESRLSSLFAESFQSCVDLVQLFRRDSCLGEGSELAEGKRAYQLHLRICLKSRSEFLQKLRCRVIFHELFYFGIYAECHINPSCSVMVLFFSAFILAFCILPEKTAKSLFFSSKNPLKRWAEIRRLYVLQ